MSSPESSKDALEGTKALRHYDSPQVQSISFGYGPTSLEGSCSYQGSAPVSPIDIATSLSPDPGVAIMFRDNMGAPGLIQVRGKGASDSSNLTGLLPNVPDSPFVKMGAAESPSSGLTAGSHEGRRDIEALNARLRENGFAPLSDQGSHGGACDRMHDVLEQFSRRGALVQELIVARERARVDERALAQKAAYHERDAAQMRKRLESAQHLAEMDRSARSPPEDKMRLSSRLAASEARREEGQKELRSREALAEDLKGRLRQLVAAEEKQRTAANAAFRACMKRDVRAASGLDMRTLTAIAGFIEEARRQRKVVAELQAENRGLNVALRDLMNDVESVGAAAEARRHDAHTAGLMNELAMAREEVASLARAKAQEEERRAALQAAGEGSSSRRVEVGISQDREVGRLKSMIAQKDSEIASLRKQQQMASMGMSSDEAAAVRLLVGARERVSLLDSVGATVRERDRLRGERDMLKAQLADAMATVARLEARASSIDDADVGKNREVDAFRKALCALCAAPADSSLPDCLASVAKILASSPNPPAQDPADLQSQMDASHSLPVETCERPGSAAATRADHHYSAVESRSVPIAAGQASEELVHSSEHPEVATGSAQHLSVEAQATAGAAATSPVVSPPGHVTTPAPVPRHDAPALTPPHDTASGGSSAAPAVPLTRPSSASQPIPPPVVSVTSVAAPRPSTAPAQWSDNGSNGHALQAANRRPRALAWEVDLRGVVEKGKATGTEGGGWIKTAHARGELNVREITPPPATPPKISAAPRTSVVTEERQVKIIANGNSKAEADANEAGERQRNKEEFASTWAGPSKANRGMLLEPGSEGEDEDAASSLRAETLTNSFHRPKEREVKGLAWTVDYSPIREDKEAEAKKDDKGMSELQLACMRHVQSVKERHSLGGGVLRHKADATAQAL